MCRHLILFLLRRGRGPKWTLFQAKEDGDDEEKKEELIAQIAFKLLFCFRVEWAKSWENAFPSTHREPK